MSNAKFIITTKDDKMTVVAKTKEDALRKYFRSLEDIDLSKIGNIVMLQDDKGDEYPFRTVPSAVLLGLLDFPSGVLNIQNCMGTSEIESEQLLLQTMIKDVWIRRPPEE